MKKLEILQTVKTPYILIDLDNGVLSFKGRSIPENPYDFYENILSKLEEYTKVQKKDLIITFDFEYINSASIKLFMELFKIVNPAKTEIIWFYVKDDDDILEAGEIYKHIFKNTLNIQLKPKEK